MLDVMPHSETGETSPARNEFPTPPPPEDSGSGINLEASALELWAQRKTVFLIATVCLVISGLISLIIPPYYTATSSVVPPSMGPSASSGIAASLSALGATGLLGPVKSSSDLFLSILKSRTVSDRIIDRFDLRKVYHVKKRSLAEKQLATNTAFEADTKSSVITISVTDTDPQRARDIANAYIDEMRTENGSLALTENSQRRLFFEQQLAKEKNELADAEVALRKSQEASGLISPSGQTMSQIQALAGLRAQIQGREVQLAALRQSATEQNPEFVRLRSEIADLQGQLARMQNGKMRTDAEGIPTSQVPAVALEYVRKARDVKYHESLFEIIAKQYEAARLDEANNSPVMQVLDLAITPDTKAGPHRSIILGAGLVFGLIAGAVWVLFRSRMREQ